MFTKKILPSLLLALLVISCSNKDGEFVALIGDTFIKEGDINKTIALESLYRGKDIPRVIAFIILINDTLEFEIGKKVGVVVTVDELDAFSTVIDKKMKDKELLENIKDVFDKNAEAYNRLYLSPRILNRKIRQIYSNDKNIHRAEINAIEKAKKLIDSGSSFESAAEKSKTEYFKRELEIEGSKTNMPAGHLPDGVKGYVEVTKKYTPKDPLIKLVKTMKEGETFNNIIEDDSSYKIIRLLKNNEDAFKVEIVTAKKKAIDVWFKEQADFINIRVVDKEMKQILLNEYENMWWIDKI